jgi:hypothetical protein
LRSPRCTVCRDPRAQAIDDALGRGTSERIVARRFVIPKSSIHTHKVRHLRRPEPLPGTALADEAKPAASPKQLQGQLRDTREALRRVADSAQARGNLSAAVAALTGAARLDELLLKAAPPENLTHSQAARELIQILARLQKGGIDFAEGALRLGLARAIAEDAELREVVRAMLAAADAGTRPEDLPIEVLMGPPPPEPERRVAPPLDLPDPPPPVAEDALPPEATDEPPPAVATEDGHLLLFPRRSAEDIVRDAALRRAAIPWAELDSRTFDQVERLLEARAASGEPCDAAFGAEMLAESAEERARVRAERPREESS